MKTIKRLILYGNLSSKKKLKFRNANKILHLHCSEGYMQNYYVHTFIFFVIYCASDIRTMQLNEELYINMLLKVCFYYMECH